MLILFGFVIVIVFLEIVFRTIIPASEVPFYTYDRENYIRKFNKKNGAEGVRTLGVFAQTRGKWRINNHGWNSNIDYTFEKKTNKKRVCIIGDSFVEATNVDTEENFGYLLNNLLGTDSFEVYTFGQSGWPASAYLHFNRYLVEHYNPDLVIILLVHNDFEESLVEKGDSYHMLFSIDTINNSVSERNPISPEYSSFVYKYELFKKSALIRYLYYNLKVHYWFSLRTIKSNSEEIVTKNEIPIIVKSTSDSLSMLEQEMDTKNFLLLNPWNDYIYNTNTGFVLFFNNFLDKIQEANKSNRFLLVMNSPDNEGNKGQNMFNEMVSLLSKMDSVDCIDLRESFSNAYRKTEKSNVISRFDPHWNEQGHEVAAQEIYKYIKENNLLE